MQLLLSVANGNIQSNVLDLLLTALQKCVDSMATCGPIPGGKN